MTTLLTELVSGYASPVHASETRNRQSGLLETLASRLRRLFCLDRVNLRVVTPHGLYRSGQMHPARLAKCVRKLGIRSIINLRGANPRSAWYREERETAARLAVEHHDFRLYSQRLPTRQELRWLIFLFDVCPRPVLIHCKAGAERSGLAAAIHLLLDGNESFRNVERQLSLRYRVVPWHKVVLTWQCFFQLYRDWLAAEGCRHARAHFRHWASKVYAGPLAESHDHVLGR